MRSYGKLQCAFWTDNKIISLGCESRLLLIYLITGPHSNALGAYRLPIAYAAEDVQWTREKTVERLNELIETGWILYEQSTQWVYILNFLRWNPPENDSVAKGIIARFQEIPSESFLRCSMVDSVLNACSRFGSKINLEPLRSEKVRCQHRLDTAQSSSDTLSTPSRHPVDTLSTGSLSSSERVATRSGHIEPEPEPEIEPEPEKNILFNSVGNPTTIEPSEKPTKTPRRTSAATGVSKQMRHALVTTFFDELFWPNYPRHQKRADALKAMLKLDPTADLQSAIMGGLTRAKASRQWQRDGGDYIPLAATWIRAEQWTDEHEVQGIQTEPRRAMTSEEKRRQAIEGALALTSGKTYEH